MKLIPYRLEIMEDALLMKIERILPIPDFSDFYVEFKDQKAQTRIQKPIKRRSLPRVVDMLEWGVIKAGDIIAAKNKESEAELLPDGGVRVDGIEQSMQAWLKEIYGWSSIQTYVFAVHKESGKTLHEIREEYMEREKATNDELQELIISTI